MQTISMSLNVGKTSTILDKKQALFNSFCFLNTHFKKKLKTVLISSIHILLKKKNFFSKKFICTTFLIFCLTPIKNLQTACI